MFISQGFNYVDDQYVRPLKDFRIEHLKRNVCAGVGLKEMKIIYKNIYDDMKSMLLIFSTQQIMTGFQKIEDQHQQLERSDNRLVTKHSLKRFKI